MTNNIVEEGKGGIRVEVVLHSVSSITGKEVITFLVDHPRIVHAEELKHRMFSYSAASSRAIPAAKMAEQLTGMPVSFGKNQSGMQAGEEHMELVRGKFFAGLSADIIPLLEPEEAWRRAKEDAVFWSSAFASAGYHKQVYNRLTEPFQMIRVLVTATETDNFYWLRNDKAADPTLEIQARCMQEAHKLSKPQVLQPGEWHLPFVAVGNSKFHTQEFYEDDLRLVRLNLDEAIKVSCARCAATSFRATDYGLEQSLRVYDRLVNGDKVHAGALEHCCTPMAERVENFGTHMTRKDWINVPTDPSSWQDGISHMDKQRKLWSGNFMGWIQYRKTIPNECYKGA